MVHHNICGVVGIRSGRIVRSDVDSEGTGHLSTVRLEDPFDRLGRLFRLEDPRDSHSPSLKWNDVSRIHYSSLLSLNHSSFATRISDSTFPDHIDRLEDVKLNIELKKINFNKKKGDPWIISEST